MKLRRIVITLILIVVVIFLIGIAVKKSVPSNPAEEITETEAVVEVPHLEVPAAPVTKPPPHSAHDRPFVHGVEFPGFEIDEELIIAEFEEIVEAGESMLTRGYEIKEGVFLFTKITPTTELKIVPNQKNWIRYGYEQFAADISGNHLKDESVISSCREFPRDERSKSGSTDGKSKYTNFIDIEINVLDGGERFRLRGATSVAPFEPND